MKSLETAVERAAKSEEKVVCGECGITLLLSKVERRDVYGTPYCSVRCYANGTSLAESS